MSGEQDKLSSDNLELINFLESFEGKVEVISGVPIFTISSENINLSISKIVEFLDTIPIFRIINSDFIGDAVKYGVDKNTVEENDFRGVVPYLGFDIAGLEEKALAMGLKRSDVFCGSPYESFMREKYSSIGLGIPIDRSAILIFDNSKVEEVAETDGYVFNDLDNKRQALFGVVKFERQILEFEKKLDSCRSVEEKIKVFEEEIFQNLNTKEDLEKVPYLALNMSLLLHQESSKNIDFNLELINKLKELVRRLKYESRMIDIIHNMDRHIFFFRKAFKGSDISKMNKLSTSPDFVIRTINNYFEKLEIDQKHKDKLLRIVKEAEQCKKDFNL